LRISPEQTRLVSQGGGQVPGAAGPKTAQKPWLLSNFALTMDGLDASRVSRIESFTVRQPVPAGTVGDRRQIQKELGKLDFPNIKVTLAEAHAETWIKWHEDFVIKGNSGDDQEKNGAIVILSPNMQDEQFRVNLFSCGILSVAPEKASGTETIRKVTAELYCERMEFVAPKGIA
jgi:hypothetical protein